MKILFICKHNKFRSKVAEAIFNKLNKNKNIVAESAGSVGSIHKTPEIVVKILKERSYDTKRTEARKFKLSKINDFDIIIIVASNVDPLFFKGFKGKIIHWKISDCPEEDIKGVKRRINEIEKKVKKLVKDYSSY